ncbi:MAG: hypothetical protein EHM78_16750 [Myxococcaceae bacterium]|nr:MAG: hypothetical protein EHM78_16750 [Myxococcaceae bacterium]
MTGTVDEGRPGRRTSPRLHPGLGRLWRALVDRLLGALDRLRLPGATVLPVAGAVVGLYGGLAARRWRRPRSPRPRPRSERSGRGRESPRRSARPPERA